MGERLKNCRIAVLATDGFEETELTRPVEALQREGAIVDIISPKEGKIKAWKNGQWSIEVEIDQNLDQSNPDEYDGLILPGGVMNPDKLRKNEKAISFVKNFTQNNKPVAAICHGPWTLIETGDVKGKRMTSYDSIQTDLKNAGADWVNEEVVVDQNLITSRNPDDLPAFIDKTIEVLEKVKSTEKISY